MSRKLTPAQHYHIWIGSQRIKAALSYALKELINPPRLVMGDKRRENKNGKERS